MVSAICPSVFYEMEEVERVKSVLAVKTMIVKGEDSVLRKMHNVVKRDVTGFDSDFYIHDVKALSDVTTGSFLWIVRVNGTHLIDLKSENFELVQGESVWMSSSIFHSILQSFKRRIVGFYLIEKTDGQLRKIQKINEQSAMATMAIHADDAVVNRKMQLINEQRLMA